MFLSIDVGNTQTTLALFDREGSCQRQWRMATTPSDTSDQLHERLFGYFLMLGMELESVKAVAIASVVPILSQEWERCIKAACKVEPLLIDASRDCGIAVNIPVPGEAGADRIANALAAKQTYGAPVIVVDFGTATNIDVVNVDGEFVGGTIMPGILLSAQSLFTRAARLSSVPLVLPPHAIGDSTETAVQSGIVLGAAAQAEGLVARIKAELGSDDVTVVGTGGYAKTLAEATDLFDAIDVDLTTRGIYQIWRNRAEKRGEL